jgi:hypothetical protein
VNPGYATEAAKRKRKEDGGNWRRGGRNGRWWGLIWIEMRINKCLKKVDLFSIWLNLCQEGCDEIVRYVSDDGQCNQKSHSFWILSRKLRIPISSIVNVIVEFLLVRGCEGQQFMVRASPFNGRSILSNC